MIVIYLSFILRNKIFDIAILVFNVILFFTSILLVEDQEVNLFDTDSIKEKIQKYNQHKNITLYYDFYHVVGQKYSTTFVYTLLPFLYIGFILGFILFYYENNIFILNQKPNYNNIEKYDDRSSDTDEIEENPKIELMNELKEEESVNNIKDYNLKYYPLSFLIGFLIFINRINEKIKILILFICLILFIFLCIGYQLYINNDSFNFAEVLTTPLKLYFVYEKHISIILFFITTVILITIQKKGFFKTIINSRIITALSRNGFTITCLYFFLSYFTFCTFFIKIKFHIPTFLLISIGNFLIIFFICCMINIIIELPLRMMVKKLLRMNKKLY
jgi:hypothetical protein